MPAQLILVELGSFHAPSAKDDSRTKPQDAQPKEKRAKPSKKPKSKYPPFRPFPVTSSVIVFGQNPKPLGHFETLNSLVQSLQHGDQSLGGASNTLFATVETMDALDTIAFHDDLAKLPDELTIIVGHSLSDAKE